MCILLCTSIHLLSFSCFSFCCWFFMCGGALIPPRECVACAHVIRGVLSLFEFMVPVCDAWVSLSSARGDVSGLHYGFQGLCISLSVPCHRLHLPEGRVASHNEYRRVQVRGRWMHDHSQLVGPVDPPLRVSRSPPFGFDIITPLEMEDGLVCSPHHPVAFRITAGAHIACDSHPALS